VTTIVTAAGVFIGTNIDDLLVLTVLMLAHRAHGVPKVWQIWAGQYLGIGALVAVSVLAALGLTIVPDRWVGLLGVIPIALGIRALVRKQDGGPRVATSALTVAAVTIANGADNISVYTPLFRTIGAAPTAVAIAVFALLTAGWCLAATWLASHKPVVAAVERWGHWIVPAVFIIIGIAILSSLW
jgi:cadmium resistance protein CadD (predicted permease)